MDGAGFWGQNHFYLTKSSPVLSYFSLLLDTLPFCAESALHARGAAREWELMAPHWLAFQPDKIRVPDIDIDFNTRLS
jgi:hypothetical protein